MYRILLSILFLALLSACNNQPKTELQAVENVEGTAVYGDSIANANIMGLEAVQTAMKDETKVDMKIRGIIQEVCQEKGCWITMKLSNGEDMRVTFKDYKIFVPKDLAGKQVILDGFAYRDTVSVEELQHFAKDAGKSDTEISAIKNSKQQIAFEAKGLVVVD